MMKKKRCKIGLHEGNYVKKAKRGFSLHPYKKSRQSFGQGTNELQQPLLTTSDSSSAPRAQPQYLQTVQQPSLLPPLGASAPSITSSARPESGVEETASTTSQSNQPLSQHHQQQTVQQQPSILPPLGALAPLVLSLTVANTAVPSSELSCVPSRGATVVQQQKQNICNSVVASTTTERSSTVIPFAISKVLKPVEDLGKTRKLQVQNELISLGRLVFSRVKPAEEVANAMIKLLQDYGQSSSAGGSQLVEDNSPIEQQILAAFVRAMDNRDRNFRPRIRIRCRGPAAR
jgi:hypothetical protein